MRCIVTPFPIIRWKIRHGKSNFTINFDNPFSTSLPNTIRFCCGQWAYFSVVEMQKEKGTAGCRIFWILRWWASPLPWHCYILISRCQRRWQMQCWVWENVAVIWHYCIWAHSWPRCRWLFPFLFAFLPLRNTPTDHSKIWSSVI